MTLSTHLRAALTSELMPATHQEIQSGFPSDYFPIPMQLNFIAQMGSGESNMAGQLANFNKLKNFRALWSGFFKDCTCRVVNLGCFVSHLFPLQSSIMDHSATAPTFSLCLCHHRFEFSTFLAKKLNVANYDCIRVYRKKV